MARSDDMALPVAAAVILTIALAGIFLYGRNAAAAAKKAAPPDVPLVPIGFLPGLKVGDVVVVDTAEADIPLSDSGGLPLLVCRVDMLLVDPTLVSVRAVGAPFKGTIVRSAIRKVLPTDPGQLQLAPVVP